MKYTINGQKKMTNGDTDYRYMIRVYLIRVGRPKYWNFHCPQCGEKVCELNGELAYMIDVTPDSRAAGTRFHCQSRTCRGMWFEFSLK